MWSMCHPDLLSGIPCTQVLSGGLSAELVLPCLCQVQTGHLPPSPFEYR